MCGLAKPLPWTWTAGRVCRGDCRLLRRSPGKLAKCGRLAVELSCLGAGQLWRNPIGGAGKGTAGARARRTRPRGRVRSLDAGVFSHCLQAAESVFEDVGGLPEAQAIFRTVGTGALQFMGVAAAGNCGGREGTQALAQEPQSARSKRCPARGAGCRKLMFADVDEDRIGYGRRKVCSQLIHCTSVLPSRFA